VRIRCSSEVVFPPPVPGTGYVRPGIGPVKAAFPFLVVLPNGPLSSVLERELLTPFFPADGYSSANDYRPPLELWLGSLCFSDLKFPIRPVFR